MSVCSVSVIKRGIRDTFWTAPLRIACPVFMRNKFIPRIRYNNLQCSVDAASDCQLRPFINRARLLAACYVRNFVIIHSNLLIASVCIVSEFRFVNWVSIF